MTTATGTPVSVWDHTDIRAVVDGIDSAVDAKDWRRCRAYLAYFTDQIDADFSQLGGGEPGPMAADDLVAAWRTILHADKRSHHIRTHHEITIDGNWATVRSKAYIPNTLGRDLGSDRWELWANFTHTLARTADGWRCGGMRVAVVHACGNESVRTHVLES